MEMGFTNGITCLYGKKEIIDTVTQLAASDAIEQM
jgi:hypothetical protein